jgi:hypothetical protein
MVQPDNIYSGHSNSKLGARARRRRYNLAHLQIRGVKRPSFALHPPSHRVALAYSIRVHTRLSEGAGAWPVSRPKVRPHKPVGEVSIRCLIIRWP